MNALAALLFLVPFQGPSFGIGIVEDFILTEKQAYMVMPPQAVGSSQTIFMSWSPSGRYLLMGQQRPQMTPALLRSALSGNRPANPAMAVSIWDKNQNRTIELGSIPNYRGPLTWLAGRDLTMDLLIENIEEGTQERASLIRIDAASGKLVYIPISNPIPEGTFYQLSISPVSPMAVLIETATYREAGLPKLQSKSVVLSIDEFGRSKSKLSLPIGSPHVAQWLQDGRALVSMFKLSPEGKRTQERYAFDPVTGTMSPLAGQVSAFRAKVSESDLEVTMSQMLAPPGTPKRSQFSAWMKDAKQSAPGGEYMLSPRADAALLSPRSDAVAVLDQGVVTVRLLASVPKEMYLQAKAAAERASALSDVKQVGLACLMYSADHDDALPGPGELGYGTLDPYMKNASVYSGFTYTFPGGSLRDLKNPSGTMLGYKPVAGGFAVVFADGSARLLNELPKNP